MSSHVRSPDIEVHPLTPERWADLERLFGPNGAWEGCWCMYFRMRASEWRRKTNVGNKRRMKAIVDSAEPPGLLAYVNGEPAGWCALDPRERFPHIERSRKLKRMDDRPVWSIVCFVIDEKFRRQGLMTRLLRAAMDYAASRGATTIEAYPIEPEGDLETFHGYTGIVSTFRRAGFREVARPRPNQSLMRYEVRS